MFIKKLILKGSEWGTNFGNRFNDFKDLQQRKNFNAMLACLITYE